MVVELQRSWGTEQGKARRKQTYTTMKLVGINQNLKPSFSDLQDFRFHYYVCLFLEKNLVFFLRWVLCKKESDFGFIQRFAQSELEKGPFSCSGSVLVFAFYVLLLILIVKKGVLFLLFAFQNKFIQQNMAFGVGGLAGFDKRRVVGVLQSD